MHRTTTTATLLVTVAVSALAGCVTIQQPPAPVQPSAPARPSVPPQPVVPPPAPESQPQIVQAPAREALEMVGPPRRTEPTPPDPAEAPAAPHHPPSHRAHPHPKQHHDQHPHPHPQPRGPHHPEQHRHPRPRTEIPDVSKPAPKDSDVCSLGRKYGGWRQGSQEATICDQTYGR
ncbi:hypothetical protein ACFYWX_36295 [Streptomyces sp. NPDC002888]|uniref:hypothetical protein n=1 Tax=Streptomyces sp. NPDC002888 TaxID=3364668 RepID=UPI003680A1B3